MKNDNGNFNYSASIPEEDNSTRIALSLNEKNVKLSWEGGDHLNLLFVQGENKAKQVVTVKNISPDGKKSDFGIEIPDTFDADNYDLYGVYGGGGLSDTDTAPAILPSGTGRAVTLYNIGDARLIAETDGGAYNYADGGAIYDLINEEFTGSESAEDYISLDSPERSILSGESISFWAWHPTLPDINWPELTLVINDSEG